MNRRAFTALGGAFLALPGLACATEVLGGRVILSITGPTGGGMADINCDLDMLDQLGNREIRTTTPWNKTALTYSGPDLADMLDNFQLVGETVRLLALNDYGVDMPMADIRRMRPLLATRADGVPLPRRDKGPIFVMFDFDGLDKPEGKLASSYAVWQLRSIGLR